MFNFFKKKNVSNDTGNEPHDPSIEPCADSSISWDNLSFCGETPIIPEAEDKVSAREAQLFTINNDQDETDNIDEPMQDLEPQEQSYSSESDASSDMDGMLSDNEIDQIMQDVMTPVVTTPNVPSYITADYRRSFSDSELDEIVERNLTVPTYTAPRNVILTTSQSTSVNEQTPYIMPRMSRPSSGRNAQSAKKLKDWALELIEVLR
jgi:hypothetical protein